eukprot:gene46412-64832_t
MSLLYPDVPPGAACLASSSAALGAGVIARYEQSCDTLPEALVGAASVVRAGGGWLPAAAAAPAGAAVVGALSLRWTTTLRALGRWVPKDGLGGDDDAAARVENVAVVFGNLAEHSTRFYTFS